MIWLQFVYFDSYDNCLDAKLFADPIVSMYPCIHNFVCEIVN